ncbi:MAG: TonB-dependent receptor [Bryobacteraceae bacterium]
MVHIRLRESFPDQFTARIQGGSFNTQRGFLSFSPDVRNVDSFLAYEGSHTDGSFVKPLAYRRDSVTGNFTRRRNQHQSYAFKWNASRSGYDSSGQIPFSEVAAGRLSRFGYLDSGEGGKFNAATLAGYWRNEGAAGDVWKLDGFVSRSLFDLYSDFTFFLNDPVNGDAIQQHDSRLQQGANLQYQRPHRMFGVTEMFTAGVNFHANQINVGLYPRIGREPLGVTARDHANLTNAAGYIQDSASLLSGKLLLGGGVRYDVFRYDVRDLLDSPTRAARNSGNWQPKFSAAFTPRRSLPFTLHANYGRGISSLDARSIVKSPGSPFVATTDFFQAGTSHRFSRFGVSTDVFLIDRSHELVYVADDGTLDLLGPSRAYGYEAKVSVEITRRLSFSGGVTKVGNSFYRGTAPRLYVDRAPHLTANAGVTLANWRGWSGSLRMRAINHYRLDGLDPGTLASGHTVWDFSLVRRISRWADFNLAADNLLNRAYWETQNYIESRPHPGVGAAFGIHGTPGYPRTFTAGLTFRLRGK